MSKSAANCLCLVLAWAMLGCASSGNSGGGGTSASSCSSKNCAGCCQSGVCQPGNTNFSCGFAGTICDICIGTDTCGTFGCELNGEAKWLISATNATISANNNGSSWDADGSPPDVFVKLTCPPSSSPTSSASSAQESYSPHWSSGGCVAKAKDLLAQPFFWQVIDKDAAFDDPITGTFQSQLSKTDLEYGAISFGANDGVKAISFTITPP